RDGGAASPTGRCRRRWPLGGPRRRRLPVGPGRAARMNPVLRGDVRRRPPRRAAPALDRGGRAPAPGRGPSDPLGAGARPGRRGCGRPRGAPVAGGGAGVVTARTKLVCTLGPASSTPEMVQGLVRAGASVFRINFSHGTPQDHERMVTLVREAEAAVGRPLAALVDLPGPKVRLGQLDPDPIDFEPGQRFELRPDGPGNETGAATTYPGLAGDLRPGDRILLADGAVELSVEAVQGGAVRTRCIAGGAARSGQGVIVPAERLGLH